MINVEYHRSSNADRLYELMEKNPKNQRISLNLYAVKHIKPNEVILIVMFLIHLSNLGNIIEIIMPENEKTKEYLEAIELIKFCNKNLRMSSTLDVISSQTAMPIRRLTEDKMSEYIDFSKDYFQSICNGKDLTMLNLCMAELLNNVYNHSKSNIDAYAFCQYFPQKSQIKVVVGDYGVGIPHSVNTYLKSQGSINENFKATEALNWALQLNNSAKSIPRNQGKGLDNVVNFIKSNKSNLFIYTNDAYLRINSKSGFEEIIEKNYINNFKGTIVAFTINVNNLDNDDESLEDFAF